MDKPANIYKNILKQHLNDRFDKKKPIKERREERHKLQIEIENNLMNVNIKTLKKIFIMIKSYEFQQNKQQKYYKKGTIYI